MKRITLCLAALFSVAAVSHAQVIFSDQYTYTNGNGTGFVLGEGLNSGINPPTTRITGTAAANLRYMNVGPKPDTSFLIQANRMRVTAGAQSGRATLSANGTAAFSFGTALGVGSASASSPIVYDIRLTLDNNANGTHRMSFGFATIESSAGDWDFGLQLHKDSTTDNFYTVSKRMDSGSSGIPDRNDTMTTLGANSAGTEVSFLIRVTDAGSESGGNYNSRIQVSSDDGASWFYDSDEDSVLVNGFRFDGAGRYMSFDVAGANSSFVTYDDVSITLLQPTAGSDSATRKSGSGTKILASSLLTNDTVPAGTKSIISVAANSAEGGTVATDGTWIYYTPSGNPASDSFTYTVGNGNAQTATGTVTITLEGEDNSPSPNLLPPTGTPGDFTVNFAGIPGRTYTVQWAPSVDGPWQLLGSAMTSTNGFGSYHDTVDHSPDNAFYRTVYP